MIEHIKRLYDSYDMRLKLSFSFLSPEVVNAIDVEHSRVLKSEVLTGAGNDFYSGVDFTRAGRYMDKGPDEMRKILRGKIHRVALTLEDIDMAGTAA